MVDSGLHPDLLAVKTKRLQQRPMIVTIVTVIARTIPTDAAKEHKFLKC